MTPRSLVALVAALFLLVAVLDSFYIVNETQRAVLKRFAQIVETDLPPALHFKWPFVDEAIRVDGRTLVHDLPGESYLTSEKKLLDVNAFVIWRVADVERYVTVVGDMGAASPERMRLNAQQLLDPRVSEGLRNQVAERTVEEVVAGEREDVMDAVAERVNALTMQDFGIEVVDIRMKQVDWPAEVREQVFERMRAERSRDAARHRSEGREAAERIRAHAERQRTVLLAEAFRDAEQIRGEGDARAAELYAGFYEADSEFYSFYRSMQAYRESFSDKSDVLLLEPDGDFFRYLKDSEGGR